MSEFTNLKLATVFVLGTGGAIAMPTASEAGCWISTFNAAGEQVRATERNTYSFASAAQSCWNRAVLRLQADASRGAVRAEATLECRGVTQNRTFWTTARPRAFGGC